MAKLVLIKEPEKCLRGSQEQGRPGANGNWKNAGSTLKRRLFLAEGNGCG